MCCEPCFRVWSHGVTVYGYGMVIDFRIRVISLTRRLGFGVRFGLESSILGQISAIVISSGYPGGGKCLLYLRSATRRRWRTIGRKRINVSYTLRDVTAQTASSAVHAVQSLHSSPPSVGSRPNLTAAMLTRPPRDTRPTPTATVQPKVSI